MLRLLFGFILFVVSGILPWKSAELAGFEGFERINDHTQWAQGFDEQTPYLPPTQEELYEDMLEARQAFQEAAELEKEARFLEWIRALERCHFPLHRPDDLPKDLVPESMVEDLWLVARSERYSTRLASIQLMRTLPSHQKPPQFVAEGIELLLTRAEDYRWMGLVELISREINVESEKAVLQELEALARILPASEFLILANRLNTDQVYSEIWPLLQRNSGLHESFRLELLVYFLERGNDPLREDLLKRFQDEENRLDLTLFVAALRAETPSKKIETMMTLLLASIHQWIQQKSLQDLKSCFDRISRSSFREPRLWPELLQPVIDALQSSDWSIQEKTFVFQHILESKLSPDFLDSDQLGVLFRLRMPELLSAGLIDQSQSQFANRIHQARRFLHDPAYIHYYFYASIVRPAYLDEEAQDFFISFTEATRQSADFREINMPPDIIFESLRSQQIRKRALAEELAYRMIDDESFDQLLKLMLDQNQKTLALEVITRRDRLSPAGAEWLLQKLQPTSRFHADHAIYFAMDRWGKSAEPMARELLHLRDRNSESRHLRREAIATFVLTHGDQKFWGSLSLQELSQTLKCLRTFENQPEEARDFSMLLHRSAEQIQDESLDLDQRIELAKDFFNLFSSWGNKVEEENWNFALDLADWCFDNFFDRNFDEALLFFYLAAKRELGWSHEAFEERVLELRESIRP